MLRQHLIRICKRLIPKISDTERTALVSGGKSIENGYFRGSWQIKKIVEQYPLPTIDPSSSIFQKTDALCQKINDYQIFTAKKIPSLIVETIKNDGFLGLIIPPQYGGLGLNHHEQSQVVQKISSASNPVGVLVMVPNSLGPAELLVTYGTEFQKKKYLQGLALGQYIPCFGLTGPHSGSDAAAMLDKGIVFLDDQGQRKIRVSLNKRYITLAPIANLIGVAFKLQDPEGLLKDGKEGISLALLPRESVIIGSYHNPMDVPFPNGTIEAYNVVIDLDNIIGGEANAGNGWQMLMECLSVGRAISLPACAVGSAKLATTYASTYSVYRKQFKVKLADMEGIREKLASMTTETLKITAIQHLTNAILDNGETPTVISAIMKYESTERSRMIVNLGMDIVAGAGICKGPLNILANHYQSIPIGITVEGSNTLTKNLIIFGNGLLKSHPFLYDLVDSLENNKEVEFIQLLQSMIASNLGIAGRVLGTQIGSVIFHKDIDFWKHRFVSQFALTSNLVLFLGKKFKSNEYTSARMAEILGSLYICTALEWYAYHCPQIKNIAAIAIKEEFIKIHQKFKDISLNVPHKGLRLILQILQKDRFGLNVTDADRDNVARHITEDDTVRSLFRENIHIPPHLQEMIQHYEKILWYHSLANRVPDPELDRIVDRAIQVDRF